VKMKVITGLIQGTPEWHAHRENYRNASETPIVMNHSPYMKRSELIHYIKTGDKKAISEYVQKYILDKGHRFEALARPLAEEIIGEDLSPLVGVYGEDSASFDGITFFHDISFEHKSMNDAIRAANTIDALPIYYKEQMESQCNVSGCEKTLFLATRWEPVGEDDDEEGARYGYADNERGVLTRYKLVEEKHFMYYPDMELRARIVAGWEQLEKDVAAYEPAIIESAPEVAPIADLPAIVVHGNTFPDKAARDSYTTLAKAMLTPTARIPTNQQEAGDLLSRVEKVTECEKTIKTLIEQTNVSEMDRDAFRKWLVDMQKAFSKGRIDGNKNLEAFKANQKTEMVNAATDALFEYVRELNDSLPKPFMPVVLADFWAAIKGKSNPKNMQNDIDALLAEKKIEADKIAATIRANLAAFDAIDDQNKPLFECDLSAICCETPEHFTTLVKMRVFEHQEAETKRIEQEQAQAKQACVAEPPAHSTVALVESAQVITEKVDTETGEIIHTINPSAIAHNAIIDQMKQLIDDVRAMAPEEVKQMMHMRDRIFAMRKAAARPQSPKPSPSPRSTACATRHGCHISRTAR